MDDYEGNRGWFLVNYKSYRDKGSKEEKRRADRERIAAKRAKKKKKEPIEEQEKPKPEEGSRPKR